MKVLDFAPPPTTPPDFGDTRQLARAGTQAAAENAPGASVAAAVRDSQRIGMGIMPALRAGDYAGAASAFVQSTAAALGAVPGVHMLPAFAGIIKAYHGSPHTFDEFKLEKVGTGEGAQAYGHGLYFAENEYVAKDYKDKLSNMKGELEWQGQPLKENRDWYSAIDATEKDNWRAAKMLDQTGKTGIDSARTLYSADQYPGQEWDEARRQFESGIKVKPSEGALYHVDLDVKPEELLDWDKPLSQQAPGVAEKLKEAWLAHPTAQAKQTGAEIYGTLTRTSTPEEASAQLHKAGIPGIKYLDQGSRAAGDGTSNFVIFDPSVIAMVSRNGQPLVSSADKARDGLAVLAHPDAWQPGGAK